MVKVICLELEFYWIWNDGLNECVTLKLTQGTWDMHQTVVMIDLVIWEKESP